MDKLAVMQRNLLKMTEYESIKPLSDDYFAILYASGETIQVVNAECICNFNRVGMYVCIHLRTGQQIKILSKSTKAAKKVFSEVKDFLTKRG